MDSENNSYEPIKIIEFNYNLIVETSNRYRHGENSFMVRKVSQLTYNMMKNQADGKVVTELCYNGQKCHRVPDVLVKLYGTKVQSLDLSYNELVNLEGIEGFPLLRELILDNNRLTDSMRIPQMPHLHTLSLNKNYITEIESLVTKIRDNLPCLTYLSLLGNKACPNELSDLNNDEQDYQRYRYYVLHHLPNLKFLDSNKVRDIEREEAGRRGQFMKVIRPSSSHGQAVRTKDRSPENSFSPLPKNIRSPTDHRGAYGKCRYRYSGKHSEGNRFISNNDL